jgi:hypothetical protein
MCGVACGDLFWGRRPKKVETDAVAGDPRQESALGRRSVLAEMLRRAVRGRVYCLPGGLP